LVADRSRQLSKTINVQLDNVSIESITRAFDTLAQAGRHELQQEGAVETDIVEQRFADLRYRGQSFTLTVPWTHPAQSAQAFHDRHASRYGHAFGLPVELVNIRCKLSTPAAALDLPRLPRTSEGAAPEQAPKRVRAAGYDEVCVYERRTLTAGQTLDGPALIIESMTTTFVDTGWSAVVDDYGNLRLTARASAPIT
jgi:N-methylhydantoinase A